MTDSSKNKMVPKGADVTKFEMRNLDDKDRPTYQSIKSSFTKDSNTAENARFLLSEMVHDHLSVEAEEERRFNERVAAELELIKNSASEKAEKEGFERGLSEGKEKAYSEEKARLAVMIESFGQATNLITEGRASLAKQYECKLVDLAFKMASIIVDHEVQTNRDIVSHSVKAILDKLGQEEDVRIRISSDDLEIVKALEDELKNVTHRGRISFELDQALNVGDCVVESSSGEIASLIDEKLKKLREELGKVYPKLDESSDGGGDDDQGMTGT